MNQKRLWIAAGIIALAIIIGFAFSVPHTTRDTISKSSPLPVASVPLVTVHDVFKKGVHTITGSLQAPNACTTVAAQATLLGDASSTGSRLRLALTMPIDSSVCLQLPTQVKFSTTVTAPAQLPITATVNGVVASTTAS